MPAVSPTSLAAVSGPQPARARSGRGEVRDQAPDLALELVDRCGQLADPADELAGDPADGARVPSRGRASRAARTTVRSRPRATGSSPGRARGGASAAGSGRASARPRGPRGGRPAGGPRARAHRASRPADRARAAPPGRPRGRRSGRSCRARGSSGGHRPSAWAGPGRPSRRRAAGRLDRRRDRCRQSSSAQRRSANRPAQRTQLEVAGRVAATVFSASLRPVSSAATAVWRALVQIDADDDHVLRCLLIRGDAPDRPVDTPEWGRLPRSYEVTPVGPTMSGGRQIRWRPRLRRAARI